MKNKNLLNNVIMLFAFLLLSGSSYGQVKTNEDMAKTIFEIIKNDDSEALSYYCVSQEKMTKILKGVSDTSAVAKSVVGELKDADFQKMKFAVISDFDKFIAEVKKEKLNLEDAKFEGLVTSKLKFDIGDLKGEKVYFKISFGEVVYTVKMYLFRTDKDLLIYGFSHVKEEV